MSTLRHVFHLHIPSILHNTFHIWSIQIFDDQLSEQMNPFTDEPLWIELSDGMLGDMMPINAPKQTHKSYF